MTDKNNTSTTSREEGEINSVSAADTEVQIAYAISESKKQIKQKQFKDALETIQGVYDLYQPLERIPLEGLKADCFLELNDYKAAIKCYENIRNVKPDAPFWVSVGYANVLEREGRYGQAVDQMCIALEQEFSVELAKRVIHLSDSSSTPENTQKRIAELALRNATKSAATEVAEYLIVEGDREVGCYLFEALSIVHSDDEASLIERMVRACLELGYSKLARQKMEQWRKSRPDDRRLDSLYNICIESRVLGTENGFPCFTVDSGTSLEDFELRVNGNRVRQGLKRYARQLTQQGQPSVDGQQNPFIIMIPDCYVDSDKESYILTLNELHGKKRQYSCNYPVRKLVSTEKDLYLGDFEYTGGNRIHGWCRSILGSTDQLALYINDDFISEIPVGTERYDVAEKHGEGYLHSGFDCSWDIALQVDKLELRDSYTGVSVLGTPVHVQRLDQAVKELEAALGSVGGDAYSALSTRARQKIFKSLRKMPETHLQYAEKRNSLGLSHEEGVSVIVPVFNGLEDVKRCIASIVDSESTGSFEIVCVNDGSDSPDVKEYLDHMENFYSSVTVINSDINRGFVKTVNKGLVARMYRDVVILNSDTVVPKEFVNRLKSAHLLDEQYGVITPLSNNATIFSFPLTLEDNEISSLDDLGVIDGLLQENAQDSLYEVPTGHGYCMFVSGDVLETVGEFDDEEWGIGYGEENDFCQKVKMNGWKIGAYFGMYVGHVGSVSFGSEKRDVQIKKNAERLLELYPEYDQLIQRYIKQEGLSRVERNRLQILHWKNKGDGAEDVLFLSHSLGGGTSEYIERSIESLKLEGARSIILSTEGNHLVLQDLSKSICCSYREDEIDVLREHLVLLAAGEVVINSSCNFPQELFDKFETAVGSYTVVIHDYSWICPRINMIDATGSYCGMPSSEVCVKCVSVSGTHPSFRESWKSVSVSLDLWLTKNKGMLERARKVIAPSRDAAERINAKFPTVMPTAAPHGDVFSVKPETVRYTADCIESQVIGVFGMIGDHKGLELLKKLCWLFSSRHSGVRIVFFGVLAEYEWMNGYNNVECVGEYNKDNLSELIGQVQPTAALFLSMCPETYCYALTDAIENGVFPIAFDLGAFSERIEMHNYGATIPFDTNVEPVYESISTVIASDNFRQASVRDIRSGHGYDSYIGDYLAKDESVVSLRSKLEIVGTD